VLCPGALGESTPSALLLSMNAIDPRPQIHGTTLSRTTLPALPSSDLPLGAEVARTRRDGAEPGRHRATWWNRRIDW
jgi:hypothetical protein